MLCESCKRNVTLYYTIEEKNLCAKCAGHGKQRSSRPQSRSIIAEALGQDIGEIEAYQPGKHSIPLYQDGTDIYCVRPKGRRAPRDGSRWEPLKGEGERVSDKYNVTIYICAGELE